MKTKLPRWQQKLTALERQHLADTMEGTITLAKFWRNREWQKKGYVCHACASIARKLGGNSENN